MKKKLIKTIALLIACVMTVGLAACGSTKTDAESSTKDSKKDKYKIGVVVKTTGNPHFREMTWGAIQAGKAYGVEIIPMSTQQEGQINEQIQLVEDLVSRGVDAVIVAPQNSSGIASAVENAKKAGVVFIPMDTRVEGAEVDTFVACDFYQSAYDIATTVAEKIGGKGNVIILEGMAGASTSEDKTRGFNDALANYPNIKIVASQNANYAQDKAQEVTADLLQGNKDIAAVIAANDLMGLGAITALEEAGYKVGADGVIVTGMDGTLASLDSIKAGKMYATEYLWSKYFGYWSVEMALQILDGNAVPKEIKVPNSAITKDNVDQFIPFGKMLAKYDFGW